MGTVLATSVKKVTAESDISGLGEAFVPEQAALEEVNICVESSEVLPLKPPSAVRKHSQSSYSKWTQGEIECILENKVWSSLTAAYRAQPQAATTGNSCSTCSQRSINLKHDFGASDSHKECHRPLTLPKSLSQKRYKISFLQHPFIRFESPKSAKRYMVNA